FIHWGERIDMSKLPAQTLALEPKAASVGGRLVFAAQRAREGSTTRGAPSLPFQPAYAAAFAAPTPGPAPALPPPAPGVAPIPIQPGADKDGLGVPIAVGVGAAALAFVIWRNRRH